MSLNDKLTVRKSDGNPEGKGANGLLADWSMTTPARVKAKHRRQVLSEFFTSMLVLSASFKFRPAVGAANYLYWSGDEWLLSLIAPDEWSDEKRAGFAGICTLRYDMTWTIAPSARLAEKNPVSDAVGRFYDAFADALDTDLTLEELLPFYVGSLGYYQRLYANALGRSVRSTLTLGDQRAIGARHWSTALPPLRTALPARQDISGCR